MDGIVREDVSRMNDEHTEVLLEALQERQGLSPLNIWVWKTERQEWEKVRPLPE